MEANSFGSVTLLGDILRIVRNLIQDDSKELISA